MIGNERADTATVVRPDGGLRALGMAPLIGLARFAKRKPLGAIGGAIVVVLIIIAVMAPVLAPYGPRSLEGKVHEPPNSEYPLGTDHLGRDLLSRIIFGARISLYVGIGSVLIGITGSFMLGVITAYAGGVVDLSFQRLIDAMMALPGLIIALAIMAVLGASLNNVIIAIVIGVLAPVVRTVRSQVLSLRELDYVTAARAVGCSGLRIVLRHIVPNCIAIYLILATYYLGAAIIIEASLSFLGVGAPADQPSWGSILTRSTEQHIKAGWWVGIFPGVTIFVVVLGFNLLGDALRDIFDPKLRGR